MIGETLLHTYRLFFTLLYTETFVNRKVSAISLIVLSSHEWQTLGPERLQNMAVLRDMEPHARLWYDVRRDVHTRGTNRRTEEVP